MRQRRNRETTRAMTRACRANVSSLLLGFGGAAMVVFQTSEDVQPRFFIFFLPALELAVEAKTTPLDDIERNERGVSGGDHVKRMKTRL